MSALINLLDRFNCICQVRQSRDRIPVSSWQVAPRLLLIPFPSESYRSELISHLDRGNYMIWNISDTPATAFTSYVIEHVHKGYPAIPLQELLAICNSMQSWLTTNASNIVMLHCKSTHLVLACFFLWHFKYKSVEVMKNLSRIFNSDLRMNPSSWRYFDYFQAFAHSDRIPKTRLKIQSVIVGGCSDACDPHVKINMVEAGEPCGIPFLFEINETFEQDVLIDFECVISGRKNGFKAMIHTGFVDQTEVVLQRCELDFAYYMPEDTYLKIEFCQGDEQILNEIFGVS